MEPPEQHAKTLEECVRRFRAAPKARLRRTILRGFFVAAGVLFLLAVSPLGGLFSMAGVVGVVLLAAAAYFVVSGAVAGTYLFAKFRELAMGCRFRNWLRGLGVVLLFLLVLWLFGVLWLWLVACAVAVAGAIALYFYVDRPIARSRAESIAQVQEILNDLRQSGQGEAEIHGFVARYGGPHWEEVFEALFGYEAKLAARRQWGIDDDGRRRKRFRPWRDPVIHWIDERLQVRKEANQRRHIQAVEERALRAQGLSPEEARRRAADVARAMVYRAALARVAATSTAAVETAPNPEPSPEALEAAREPVAQEGGGWREAVGGILYSVFAFLFGQRMRLLLGCLLMAGCALWAYQNDVLRQPDQEDLQQARQEVEDLVGVVREGRGEGFLGALDRLAPEQSADYQPLQLAWVPVAITSLFSSYNPGVAGLVLALSALVPGLKISAFMFPAVFVMLFAHTTGIPGLIEPAGNSVTSLAIGLVLVLAGYIWGRE
jgi:hypothetical protein